MDRARRVRSAKYLRPHTFFIDLRMAFRFVTRVWALVSSLAFFGAAAFGEIFLSATSVHLLRFIRAPTGRSQPEGCHHWGAQGVSSDTILRVTFVTSGR